MRILLVSVFVVLGLLISVHEYKFSQIPLWEVPKGLSAMRAKEFCTCYFLQKKGEKYCLDFVLKGYPLFEYKLDKKKQRVSFINPMAKSSAGVESNRFGCHFIED